MAASHRSRRAFDRGCFAAGAAVTLSGTDLLFLAQTAYMIRGKFQAYALIMIIGCTFVTHII